MKNNKVTIAAIAAALNISPISISRALAGQPGVGAEMKERILAKAAEMGYTKSKKPEKLAILVLHHKSSLTDNSNAGLTVQGIEKALQRIEADYHIEFVDKAAQNVLPYKLAKGALFDGVIIIGRFDLAYAALISQKVKNLIFYTGYSPTYDYDSVWYGFHNAGYKACEYLIRHGHQKIGYIGSNETYRNKTRLLAVTTALEDYQVPVNQAFFINLDEHYHQKIENLIVQKKLPTAFICDTDFIALELIRILHAHNLNVPADISVIGSGNTEMASLSIPPLTTFDLNIEYAGEVVVATLVKRINQPAKPYENIAILGRLVERDSVKNI